MDIKNRRMYLHRFRMIAEPGRLYQKVFGGYEKVKGNVRSTALDYDPEWIMNDPK